MTAAADYARFAAPGRDFYSTGPRLCMDYQVDHVVAETTLDMSQFEDVEVKGMVALSVESNLNPCWYLTVGGSIFNNPAAAEGRVYFGAMDKSFYCVSEDGALLWRFPTNGLIASSPMLAQLPAGPSVLFGSYDGALYCLDAATGKERWKFQTQGEVYSQPCLSDGVIYFGSKDRHVYALDAATGKERWRFAANGAICSSPRVFAAETAGRPMAAGLALLCFGADSDSFYALDAATGALRWKFDGHSDRYLKPASDSGLVFFGSMDGNVYALALATGALAWRYPTGSGIATDVILADGILYAGSRDHCFYALRADSSLLWRFETPDVIGHGCTVAPGPEGAVVYFGGCDNNLYAVDAATGALRWKARTGGMVCSCPVVTEQGVYFGSWDCNLYAVDKSGGVRWKFQTGLSTQARIEYPQQLLQKKAKTVWRPASSQREEKYKEAVGSLGGSSVYAPLSTYTTGARYTVKGRYAG